MRFAASLVSLLMFIVLLAPVAVFAGEGRAVMEAAVSDSLDLWREGRYEQLYERLAKRGRISREQFAERMRDSSIKPACCWQKLENFRVLNEKRNSATVYARVGMEGLPGAPEAVTREFRLLNEHGQWRMQLNDITALAGVTKKKHKKHQRRVVRYQ